MFINLSLNVLIVRWFSFCLFGKLAEWAAVQTFGTCKSMSNAKVLCCFGICRFLNWVFIQQWTHWTQPHGCCHLAYWVKSITTVLEVCRRYCRTTRICRILLPFWVWMSLVRMTKWRWPVHVKCNGFWVNPSMWLRSSQGLLGSTSIWRTVFQDSRSLRTLLIALLPCVFKSRSLPSSLLVYREDFGELCRGNCLFVSHSLRTHIPAILH